MDEDHVIGSRQVGTRSRVLQGQQQDKGLLIIHVGHRAAEVQQKMASGACSRFQATISYTPPAKTLLLGKVSREGMLLSLKQ